MYGPFYFILFIILIVGMRFLAGKLDHDRIHEYIRSLGGEVLSSSWDPFGPGWFGGNNARIYAVQYLDKDLNKHSAYCKTSMWSGVYFTQDSVVNYGKQKVSKSIDYLEDENLRLRAEIKRLKQEQ